MKGRLRSLATNLAVLAGSLLLFAVVVEIGLRLSGFSFVLYPEAIEFGAPQPELPKPGCRQDDAGISVPPDDAGAFVAALRVLLADPERCAQMGANGRRWVETHASPAAVGLAYDRLLGQL